MPLKTNFIPYQKILSAEINSNFIILNTWDIWNEDLSAQITGSNLIFTTVFPFVTGTLRVYVDGLRQRLTTNYTVSGSQIFIFAAGTAPVSGQDVIVDYRKIL